VYVERTDQIAPALEAAFAASEREGVPAVVNVKIASSEFRKGAISV
jgi:acetolactate synthase-1/2/3 large subunit